MKHHRFPLAVRFLILVIGLTVVTAFVATPEANASEQIKALSRKERREKKEALTQPYKDFLEEVDPIITREETDIFLRLESDAQRDSFIEEFWKRRDSDPHSGGNAYRETYYELRDEAIRKYGNVYSDQGRILLFNGHPTSLVKFNCRYTHQMEVWQYDRRVRDLSNSTIVFYSRFDGSQMTMFDATPRPTGPTMNVSRTPFLQSLEDLLNTTGQQQGVERIFFNWMDGRMARRPLITECGDGDVVLAALNWIESNRTFLSHVTQAPPIQEEDVERFLRSTVIRTPGSKTFETSLDVDYTGKKGSRVMTRLMLLTPSSQLKQSTIDGEPFYNIEVVGETIFRGRVYEKFRYRFDFAATPESASELPVIVERLLHPGEYELRIKVIDSNSKAEAFLVESVAVPQDIEGVAEAADHRKPSELVSEPGLDILKIASLPDEILTGFQKIQVFSTGDRISGVTFYLDGQEIMTKRRKPWELELDFGQVPRVHRVRAVGVDRKGEPVDGDEILVNTGNDPFRVRVVSPRFQARVSGRVRVELDVRIPQTKELDRVEVYFDDRLAGTLFDPPWVHHLEIPSADQLGYLRVVGYLTDETANTAEDVVIINAPDYLQEVQVHLVELPTTVTRDNRPVTDLGQDAFTILDNGEPAEIAKFEYIRDLPLSVGVAVDSSASMKDRIDAARDAAMTFFHDVLEPRDRVFVMAFDRDAYLIQPWTSDIDALRSGLSTLRAEESTALYDAVLYSLYRFEGIQGQKALIVLSDGADTASRFDYSQTLEYAKRRSIPIYVIGLGIRSLSIDVRRKLDRFSTETGGRAFFVDETSELAEVYNAIEEELRSQYLLGFYPPGDLDPGSAWREITVKVDGAEARTVRGYYP